MEQLLIAAAIASLLLAGVMSFLAWKLLRTQRERSAARVAALEAMAFSEDLADGSTASPAALRTRQAAARITYDEVPELFEFETEFDDDLDLQIRPDYAASGPAPEGFTRSRRLRPPAVSDVMFGATDERGAPRRRWLALALVLVVTAGGVGSAYALHGSDAIGRITWPTGLLRSSRPAVAAPLELLSLTHGPDSSGAFRVTGLVQNPTNGSTVTGVVAVVHLFDRQGNYVASGRATLSSPSLHPGEESPFVVTIDQASSVGRYRVGFRFEGGGVVAHVDRRGSVPVSTTGDTIDDLTATPAGTPIGSGRVEGD